MKAITRILLFGCLSLYFSPSILVSQSLPIGFSGLDDYYRRAQLLGQIDSSFSFTSRPFFPSNTIGVSNIFDPDSSLSNNSITQWDNNFTFADGRGMFQVLPFNLLANYSRPYHQMLNDGPMIPGRGLQTVESVGFIFKYGPLSLQIQPEFVWAENKTYNTFTEVHGTMDRGNYYYYFNQIDLPESFGEGPYQRASWGQSSARLTFGSISFGLSNENLWWGPGMHNSLLMTNSAPGFKHVTLNTVRPIKTPIGSFEGQLISGRLEGSGIIPSIYQPHLIPKPDDWRYLNAIVFSYQPKWVPGLFIGASRAFQNYGKDLKFSADRLLPVIIPLSKKSQTGQGEEDVERDQIASAFIRWLWPKEKAEIYFEYGRGDHAYNIRDFFLDPQHSRAYIFGLRRLTPFRPEKEEYISLNFEITHLTAVNERRLGSSYPWYIHTRIIHGYTHQGQMLGAGIGPGSNLQSINISWVKNLKVLGIQLERYVHNKEFHYTAGLDTRFNWVDFITSAIGTWDYKNFIFSAKIDGIIALNYQNLYSPIPSDPPFFWDRGRNTYSLQALIGVTYRF